MTDACGKPIGGQKVCSLPLEHHGGCVWVNPETTEGRAYLSRQYAECSFCLEPMGCHTPQEAASCAADLDFGGAA